MTGPKKFAKKFGRKLVFRVFSFRFFGFRVRCRDPSPIFSRCQFVSEFRSLSDEQKTPRSKQIKVFMIAFDRNAPQAFDRKSRGHRFESQTLKRNGVRSRTKLLSRFEPIFSVHNFRVGGGLANDLVIKKLACFYDTVKLTS